MKVFLDLDGVIFDFVGGVFDKYNVDLSHNDITDWGAIVKKVCDIKGFSRNEFWRGLDDDFWAGLSFTEDAEHILCMLKHYDTCLLTSPSRYGAGGKQALIREKLPDFFDRGAYLIGPAKSFCAAPMTMLIDDSDDNCAEFEHAGGRAFCYPRPWNKNRHYQQHGLRKLWLWLRWEGYNG